MRLGSVRDLIGIQPVLKDQKAKGPDPVYFMFNNVSVKGPWANITVMTSGRYGDEYPKTFGHYHGTAVPETYRVLEGEGVLQLQKKFFDQKMWVAEKVFEVLLVKAGVGDEVVITPEYGHGWSNVSDLPLLLIDNWISGHDPSDYAMIEKMRGLAYYLVEQNGEVKAVANEQYKELPEPEWMTAAQYNQRLKDGKVVSGN